MTELLTFLYDARGRIMMLLILTVAVIVVTYLIYTLSGRSGIIKYLPGALLVVAGFYYLYQGLQRLTEQAGLNELVSAVMFIVIGLVGVAFAMILGIYHQGEGQKTKRRQEALDYLQEARVKEPVSYPKRETVPQSRGHKAAAAPVRQLTPEEIEQAEKERLEREEKQREQDEKRRLEQEKLQKEREEKRRVEEERRRLEQEAKQKAQEERKSLILAERNAIVARTDESHAARLQQLNDDARRVKEERELQRLEQRLERKNRQRQAVMDYNMRALEVNENENAGFGDQAALFFHRNRLKLGKRGSDLSHTLREGTQDLWQVVRRALIKFDMDVDRMAKRAASPWHARMAAGPAVSKIETKPAADKDNKNEKETDA